MILWKFESWDYQYFNMIHPLSVSAHKKTQKCWWLEHGWKTTIKEFPNIPPEHAPDPQATLYEGISLMCHNKNVCTRSHGTWKYPQTEKEKHPQTTRFWEVPWYFWGWKIRLIFPFFMWEKPPRPPHLTADTLPSSRLEKERDNGLTIGPTLGRIHSHYGSMGRTVYFTYPKNHGISSHWWFGNPRTLRKTGSNPSIGGFNDS